MFWNRSPFSVLTKPKVSSGEARSTAAALRHPSAVKCQSSMNSFFSNLFRMLRAGLMSRKLGVGLSSQSGISVSASSSCSGMTSGICLSSPPSCWSCCRCSFQIPRSLSCLPFQACLRISLASSAVFPPPMMAVLAPSQWSSSKLGSTSAVGLRGGILTGKNF